MGLPLTIRLVAACMVAVAASACNASHTPGGESERQNRAGVTRNTDSARSAVNTSAGASDKTGNDGTASPGGRYKINADRSRLVAGVLVGGMFAKLGHDHAISMRDFAGEVEMPAGSMEKGSLRMTIKADSAAEIGREFKEKDRRKIEQAVREEALMAAKYPEITFKSTQIAPAESAKGGHRLKIAGDLTLHDVKRPIVLPAQVTGSGSTLHVHSEFTILHSDYRIKRLSAAGGTIKAKDPIHISCDIVAEKE